MTNNKENAANREDSPSLNRVSSSLGMSLLVQPPVPPQVYNRMRHLDEDMLWMPPHRPLVGGGAAAAYEASRHDYYLKQREKLLEQQQKHQQDEEQSAASDPPPISPVASIDTATSSVNTDAASLSSNQ